MPMKTIHIKAKGGFALSLALLLALSSCSPKAEAPAASSPSAETSAAPSPSAEASAAVQANATPSADPGTGEPQKILDARQINEEVVGWISIDNTRIDYPIVLHDDNEFYIDHDLEKKTSKSGALFLDFRNVDKTQQRHLLIYGHNMRNGTMFHDLNSFKNRDVFENNRRFKIWIFGEEREYETIALYVISNEIQFNQTWFENDEEFVNFMKTLEHDNKYRTGYEPKADDEILTLSTCSYEYDEMRCVLQAVRVS